MIKPEPLTADTIKNATIVAQREAAERAALEAHLTIERCTRALLYDADARQACADAINGSRAADRATRPTRGTPADVGAWAARDR